MHWSEDSDYSEYDDDSTPIPSFADVVRRGSLVPEATPQGLSASVEPPPETKGEPATAERAGRKRRRRWRTRRQPSHGDLHQQGAQGTVGHGAANRIPTHLWLGERICGE